VTELKNQIYPDVRKLFVYY